MPHPHEWGEKGGGQRSSRRGFMSMFMFVWLHLVNEVVNHKKFIVRSGTCEKRSCPVVLNVLFGDRNASTVSTSALDTPHPHRGGWGSA